MWTTPDPSGFAGGLNLYAYADQNPQSFIDRTGEVPVAAGIAIAWGLIEAGLTTWDVYETGSTLMDPCASLGDKILSGGSMGMSAAGPGPASLYKGLGKDVEKALSQGLNSAQLANLKRFMKKLPSGAGETTIHDLPGGGKALQAEVPGRVSGSKAIYEKQIDPNGRTLEFTKTTIDPSGSIVHVKDKIRGTVIE